jgi:cytochrome c biogenesis protein
MAQNISSQPVSQPVAGTADQAGGGVDSIFEQAWHLLTSMRVAVILIAMAALLSMAGTIVQQMPAGMAADPASHAAWVAQNAQPQYGGLAGLMDTLGLYTVFSTIYFRLVVALLVVSIMACSVHRATGLWRTATQPRVTVGEAFFDHAPQRETVIVRRQPDDVLATIEGVLRKKHFRAVTAEDDSIHLYADRNRWGPLGSLAGHVAFVVIIAGAIVSGTGFRVPSFEITEGASLPVPNRTDLTLRLDAYNEAYDPATQVPTDFASDVTLFQNGTKVATQTIRVNDPFTYDGISFYQSGRGNAVVLTARTADGTIVFDGGTPLDYTDDQGRGAGLVNLGADAQYLAYAETSLGGTDSLIKPGQVLIQVYDATTNKQVAEQVIEPNAPTTIQGYTFTYTRETKFSSFSVSRDPGAPLIWLGSTLLVVGFSLVFMFPHRRLWGRIVARPGGSQVDLASVGRKESQVGIEFTHLVNDIRAAFHAPVKD